MTTAIRFTNVSKRYRLFHSQPFLARELLRMIVQKPSRVDEHWALRNVSFEIAAGESVAVIGRNGAGKSTLLSLIAKTTYPSSGTVEVHGRVGPLLELGAGFHPDLTGLENIYLNAVLLGMRPEEVKARLQQIVDYSELGNFIDTPIRTFSIGMRARLGFSVIAHLDPDVLILDEVLGVGDARFRLKCQATMQKFREQGRTMFVVSHNLKGIGDLCDRALWIHEGEVRASGPCEEIVEYYEADLHSAKR